MRAQLGSRFEVGTTDPTLYEVASLRGPMAPRFPVALRIIRPGAHLLAEWDRVADRHAIDRAQHRAAMRDALVSVPAGWLDLPFVRPAGRSAA